MASLNVFVRMDPGVDGRFVTGEERRRTYVDGRVMILRDFWFDY